MPRTTRATLQSKPITAAQFRRMTSWEKGYVVYMFGARKDQPNVPESYEPASPASRAAYARGQHAAMLEAQDAG